MYIMELNTDKILRELKRLEKTVYWLAQEIGTSRQLVTYWLQEKSLRGADKIAKVFDIDPKELIK